MKGERIVGGEQTVQQLTCNIDLSSSFYYFFFSFVLIELKPFVLKGKGLGGKILKKCEKVRKGVRNYETILPFSCRPLEAHCAQFLHVPVTLEIAMASLHNL